MKSIFEETFIFAMKLHFVGCRIEIFNCMLICISKTKLAFKKK